MTLYHTFENIENAGKGVPAVMAEKRNEMMWACNEMEKGRPYRESLT